MNGGLNWTLLLATQLAVASPPATKPEPKNFVVFPIKTRLRRSLLFSTTADACAQIDVARCMNGKTFDVGRRLRALPRRGTSSIGDLV